jgi:Flp pilus assembly protein TadD
MNHRNSVSKPLFLSAMLALACTQITVWADECEEALRIVDAALKEPDSSAEGMLRKAIAMCDSAAEAHYNLAVIYQRQNKLAEAAGSLTSALEIRDDARFRAALGRIKVAQNDEKGARYDLERAAESKDVDPETLETLAVLYMRRGEERCRHSAFLKRFVKDPGVSPTAFFNLASIYVTQGRDDDAIQLLQEALKTRSEE